MGRSGHSTGSERKLDRKGEEGRAEIFSHSSPFKILRIRKRKIASLLSGRECYVKRTNDDKRGKRVGVGASLK